MDLQRDLNYCTCDVIQLPHFNALRGIAPPRELVLGRTYEASEETAAPFRCRRGELVRSTFSRSST
jgi:hypothetical protein